MMAVFVAGDTGMIMQTGSDGPSGSVRVVRRMWLAAGFAALAALAVVALAVDRASRVADEFALHAERRMVALEFDRRASEAVRLFNEIANWDDSVEALVKPARPDNDFLEEEVAGWLSEELGFPFVALVGESGAAKFAVADGDVLTGVLSLPQLAQHADLAELARKRYAERRIDTGAGFVVPHETGADTPGIDARSWRMFAGKPALVIAQVVIPESQELALSAEETAVLVAVKPLDGEALESMAHRLGIEEPRILPVEGATGTPGSIALAGDGETVLAFQWRPRAPRPAVISATAPFALGLFALLCAGAVWIVRRHSTALHALASSEAENRFLATHDTLTRLANRAHFDRELGGAFDRLEKSHFAVLCIDLDKFKAVNDTHGHAAGDAVLREVANRFRARIGGKGLVARVGGDEFIALIHDAGEREELLWLAEGLIEDASTPVYHAGVLLQIGASVGIAIAPRDGRNARDIIHAADMALYEAKAGGRGSARQAGGEWTGGADGVTTRAVA